MTREEAIAELSVLHERLSNPKDCEDGCYSWEDGLYVEAIDMAIEALSAEAVQGWIPCSERLPKEKARVLTYDSMGDIVFGQYDKGRWYWEAEACADYWAKNDGVIAWMPLPKPYECGARMKGGDDE